MTAHDQAVNAALTRWWWSTWLHVWGYIGENYCFVNCYDEARGK